MKIDFNDPKIYPAFPVSFIEGPDDHQVVCMGATLRDYMAAKAMQSKLLCELSPTTAARYPGTSLAQYVAKEAYIMADAMLAEREK